MAPAPLPPASHPKLIRIPGCPAVPKNSAYSDHRYAAATPTEISVSMVAAPCRALTSAARWNGHAPHTTTGEASASESHCQFRNCSAGTMASTTTGIARASDTSSRCRSVSASSAADAPAGAPDPASVASREAGRAAVYPACSTTEIRSPVRTEAGKDTRAVSVAKLTVAATPSSLFSFFSILAAHEAQVIPPIASSALRIAPARLWLLTVVIRASSLPYVCGEPPVVR